MNTFEWFLILLLVLSLGACLRHFLRFKCPKCNSRWNTFTRYSFDGEIGKCEYCRITFDISHGKASHIRSM